MSTPTEDRLMDLLDRQIHLTLRLTRALRTEHQSLSLELGKGYHSEGGCNICELLREAEQ